MPVIHYEKILEVHQLITVAEQSLSDTYEMLENINESIKDITKRIKSTKTKMKSTFPVARKLEDYYDKAADDVVANDKSHGGNLHEMLLLISKDEGLNNVLKDLENVKVIRYVYKKTIERLTDDKHYYNTERQKQLDYIFQLRVDIEILCSEVGLLMSTGSGIKIYTM